jgi:DNA-binding response OmpR family regulator
MVAQVAAEIPRPTRDRTLEPVVGHPAGPRLAELAAEPVARPARILVVDDEPQIVEFLCLLLEDEGYRATRAYDGAEAWEIVAGDLPDLVISDVMMPRLTGLQLVQHLKETANGACPPVILMSAVTSLHESPGIRFLAKPFDLDRLLDLIAELVRR